MLRLVVTHGQEEMVFAVPEKEARLGRAKENDIALQIPGVSRRHALVRRCAGGVEVLDLDSTNKLLVEGERVKRVVLTPGLRLQIGEAWLEVEEVTTTEEALARMHENPSGPSAHSAPLTAAAAPKRIPRSPSPEDAALALAYHIAQSGVGIPEQRDDLLLRIRTALGAEAFATLARTRSGGLRMREGVGTFSRKEARLFTALAGDTSIMAREQVILKRVGVILLAGRDLWFLVAKFSEESMGHEKWRKEFLKFLAGQFFSPVRGLDDMEAFEVARVYTLVKGNARRTADLLKLSPGKAYKYLRRLGLLKSRAW
ncbi:MAG TPA: FHA domain-containing protein [Thermoanaerobaculia bacterium]|nr:FHA domain-containing protein [Thermoanaerobaculia bacterium]